VEAPEKAPRQRWHGILRVLRSWLLTWEIYPILVLAGFLRLYAISSTEFDEDQAMVFRMARDAVLHGLIPATSNIASIRIVNPPAVIYLLIPVAAFTSNPLWGAVFVAILNIVAVLLTYAFVCRYYGRLAGSIAALLYATATTPVYFSRFIWQQNMIAPFVVLFLFMLFRGAVERRKGWLFPALLLLGIMVQLHETTALLAIPLVVALLLAPETVRWRDVAFGLLSLLVIFSTYIIWEIASKFFDVNVLLRVAQLHARIDGTAFNYYIDFFSPYNQRPSNPHTLTFALTPLLIWLRRFVLALVASGFVTALLLLVRTFRSTKTGDAAPPENAASGIFSCIWQGWTRFRSSPTRRGLTILLIWQVVPVLLLSRHAVPVYSYYLLLLMPGPFILAGLCASRLIAWLRQAKQPWNLFRYAIYIIAVFIIAGQFTGTTASLIDEASGNNTHAYGYNDLTSLQHAVNEADQLAQQRHLSHVYIASGVYTRVALRYLAEQDSTPTTVFDASSCLILPAVSSAPTVFLVGPDVSLAQTLLNRFASIKLVDRPPRTGSAPFQLYIVQPLPTQPASALGFDGNLQLLDSHLQQIQDQGITQLVARWNLLRNEQPIYRTTYTYTLSAQIPGNTLNSQCTSTDLQAGEQVITAFALPAGITSISSPSLSISAVFSKLGPHNLQLGPFQLENIRDQRTNVEQLRAGDGSNRINLQ
jgi:4-amino-4-deoxy-L-arabinose transferase-like glycosyltransferase